MMGGDVVFAAPGVAVDGNVPDTLPSNFVPLTVCSDDGTTIDGIAVPNVGEPDVTCATNAIHQMPAVNAHDPETYFKPVPVVRSIVPAGRSNDAAGRSAVLL